MAAAADLPLTIACYRYYAGWADKVQGKTIPITGDYFCYTRHEPVGVVGQIIPWNFPLLMQAWKLGPALAAGCTVVMKPAEQTPLTALRVGELIVEAGFPPGVVNLLPGYGPTAGAAIARHMDVDKVAFTGSTEVGKLIMQAAGDVQSQARHARIGRQEPEHRLRRRQYGRSHRRRASGPLFQSRAVLLRRLAAIRRGQGLRRVRRQERRARKRARSATHSRRTRSRGRRWIATQFEKVMSYIESGKSDRAKLVAGGNRVGDKGYFIEPTVFADVQDNMKIAQEEIFGPVMSILRFKTLDEVVDRANRIPLWPRGRRVDPRHFQGPRRGQLRSRRHRVDQLFRRLRRRGSLRRLQAVGHRPRAWRVRAPELHRGENRNRKTIIHGSALIAHCFSSQPVSEMVFRRPDLQVRPDDRKERGFSP